MSGQSTVVLTSANSKCGDGKSRRADEMQRMGGSPRLCLAPQVRALQWCVFVVVCRVVCPRTAVLRLMGEQSACPWHIDKHIFRPVVLEDISTNALEGDLVVNRFHVAAASPHRAVGELRKRDS